MDETTKTIASSALHRRTVVKGAAWSVPAITLLAATPAFAATNTVFAFTSLTPAVINATNPTDSITVSGTGPDNASISLMVGATTWGTVTVTAGEWSAVIPAGSLPEGLNVVVTAALGTTLSSTKTYTKDVTAPAPTITTFTYVGSSTKQLTVGGAAGNLSSPTEDSATLTLTGGPVSPVTVTRTGATWTHVFDNVKNNITYNLTVTQTDGANNSGSGTRTGTT